MTNGFGSLKDDASRRMLAILARGASREMLAILARGPLCRQKISEVVEASNAERSEMLIDHINSRCNA